ncbi:hypothetical protein [Pseudomonas matsuisoli]|uniref:hypothetical protein n=1 Tax=Pseudomonas matsuisoli TaxID=1515666 RepID=UPI0016645643|nr:hypothetical protein [Pseudomonas matsuisoli]
MLAKAISFAKIVLILPPYSRVNPPLQKATFNSHSAMLAGGADEKAIASKPFAARLAPTKSSPILLSKISCAR